MVLNRQEIMHIALLHRPSTTPLLLSVYQLQCTLLYKTYRDSGFYFDTVILLTVISVDMAAKCCFIHCYRVSYDLVLISCICTNVGLGSLETPAPPQRKEDKTG